MVDKILLDSNILIYAADSSSIFYEKSRLVLDSDQQLFCTYSSLLEFYRVATSKAFQNKETFQNIQSMMHYYREICVILYPTALTDLILSDLIETYKPSSGRIWDLLVLAQAVENNITTIFTKNTKDFPESPGIQISDPTA